MANKSNEITVNIALHARNAHAHAQTILGRRYHKPADLRYGVDQQIDSKANYWVSSANELLQVRCTCGRLFWEKPNMDADEQHIVTLVELARLASHVVKSRTSRPAAYVQIDDRV